MKPSDSVRSLLLRVGLHVDGGTLSKLRKLRMWQQFAPEAVEALQKRRLRDLLQHAYRRVPYYRHVFEEAGIVRTDGNVAVERFADLPLLEKQTLRDCYEDLKANDLAERDAYENKSGGSTGEPVRFVQGQQHLEWARALKMLFAEWAGYRPGEPKVQLWGSERDIFGGKESFRKRVKRWIQNKRVLNAFRMTPEEMRGYIEEINSFGPAHILAYVDSLHQLARFASREGLSLHKPRSIMTSAGTLHPHMRREIEETFKAPIFNRYGGREVSDVACESEAHAGLHVAAPLRLVEVLGADGEPTAAGEEGELVITSLTSHAMPLIRYRIGDRGAWAEECCAGGIGWPLLKQVTGRTTDVFKRADGGVVSSLYLIHLVGVVLAADWIQKYQVVQEEYERVLVRIVPVVGVKRPHETFAEDLKEVQAKVKLAMGKGCEVHFDFVDHIPPSSSGKYRYTQSEVTA